LDIVFLLKKYINLFLYIYFFVFIIILNRRRFETGHPVSHLLGYDHEN
jgi:hypothetical protein